MGVDANVSRSTRSSGPALQEGHSLRHRGDCRFRREGHFTQCGPGREDPYPTSPPSTGTGRVTHWYRPVPRGPGSYTLGTRGVELRRRRRPPSGSRVDPSVVVYPPAPDVVTSVNPHLHLGPQEGTRRRRGLSTRDGVVSRLDPALKWV